MNENIFKTLSQASREIMMDRVESIAIAYITKDGLMCSAYDKEDEASVLSLLGAVDVLKTRITHGYDIVPELSNDDDEDD